jgi:hypothetical protein
VEVVSLVVRAMVAACRCGGPTMVPRPRRPLRAEDCSSAAPPTATSGREKELVEGRGATGELASVGATLARR